VESSQRPSPAALPGTASEPGPSTILGSNSASDPYRIDINAYERFFFEPLSWLDAVQDITSSVALFEVKSFMGPSP
jgi:hypothetical protein